MAARIPKRVLSWAWLELEGAVFEWEDADRLLTAAAIVGLHQHQSLIKWGLPLPPGTTLELSGRNVMLTWQPATPGIQFPVSADAFEAARGLLEDLPKPLRQALQCVGLRGLEGNFEWIEGPPFSEPPPDGAGGTTP